MSVLSSVDTETAISYFNKGHELQQSGQLDQAIVCYQQAIEIDAKCFEAYHKLGDILQERGKLDEAIAFYRKGLEIEPSFYWSHVNLGAALAKIRCWDEATACYQAATQINPSSMNFQLFCNSLGEGGLVDEAIACVRKLHIVRGWEISSLKGYEFTRDWFSNQIPNWKQYFKQFVDVDGLNALEIGSYEGMSTCWFLEQVLTHKSARITCVDPFTASWGKYEHFFDSNILKTGSAFKVKKLRGMSYNALKPLEPSSYDFVYIDGSHFASDVLEEAILSWRLLKVGGLMIFDDYQLKYPNNPTQNPQIGIDAFLAAFSPKLELVVKSLQVIVKKIAD